jgi:hypothetical protein
MCCFDDIAENSARVREEFCSPYYETTPLLLLSPNVIECLTSAVSS